MNYKTTVHENSFVIVRPLFEAANDDLKGRLLQSITHRVSSTSFRTMPYYLFWDIAELYRSHQKSFSETLANEILSDGYLGSKISPIESVADLKNFTFETDDALRGHFHRYLNIIMRFSSDSTENYAYFSFLIELFYHQLNVNDNMEVKTLFLISDWCILNKSLHLNFHRLKHTLQRIVKTSLKVDFRDSAQEIISSLENASAGSRPCRETCPACEAPLYFELAKRGICANGHSWNRCQITLHVIQTPFYRQCIGCQLCYLPAPDEKANIIEELLCETLECVHCGCKLYSVGNEFIET
jgi:hypothetical protein